MWHVTQKFLLKLGFVSTKLLTTDTASAGCKNKAEKTTWAKYSLWVKNIFPGRVPELAGLTGNTAGLHQ